MDKKVYAEKLKRMTDVTAGITPDRVPVCGLMETYAFAYANSTVEAANKSILNHVKSYGKIY